jgi:hypothetical protein
MKAILEFNLPEDNDDHLYAISGLDSLIVIEDLLSEISSKLRHDSGYFSSWRNEQGENVKSCDETLERVRDYLLNKKVEHRIPHLT